MRDGRSLTLVLIIVSACADDPPPPSEVGAACELPDDCESGLCMTEFADGADIAGGVCTTGCMWNGDGTDTCPEGQACIRYTPTQEFLCLPRCAEDEDASDDCRYDEGWQCRDFFTLSVCVPPL